MTDTPKTDDKPEAGVKAAKPAAVGRSDGKSDVAEEAKPKTTAWLTATSSDAFGPKGRFVDLTDAERAAAPEGVLVAPTEEQLAQRV